MYRIGVDLGGTNIAAGIVDSEYRILKKKSVPTRAKERTGEEIVAAIVELCKELVCEFGIDFSEIEAIGVGSPGVANSRDGVVGYCSSLPFDDLPITKMIGEATGVSSVHVENDANAAAWGEAIAGAAKGTSDSVMITLGTGVGGGVIINNRLVSGFNFAGGELGHIVIEKGGVPCDCGRRGCWEAYSSATALVRMTKEKMEECRKTGRKTRMESMAAERGKVSGRTAFDAMREGDDAAREVVDKYLSYLATGITNIINVFQPEVLSIGGGVSGEGDNLLKPILPMILREVYGNGFVQPTKIRIAELGNDAGIIGAAYLGV